MSALRNAVSLILFPRWDAGGVVVAPGRAMRNGVAMGGARQGQGSEPVIFCQPADPALKNASLNWFRWPTAPLARPQAAKTTLQTGFVAGCLGPKTKVAKTHKLSALDPPRGSEAVIFCRPAGSNI